MCESVNWICIVRFQVLTAASMKFRVLWDVLPCSQIDVDRYFRGACCLHHQGTQATRTSETSVDVDLRTCQYIPEDSELDLYCSANWPMAYFCGHNNALLGSINSWEFHGGLCSIELVSSLKETLCDCAAL
jgi:hypothetical protein